MRDGLGSGGSRRTVWLIVLLVALVAVAILCGPDFVRGLHDGWVQASG